VLIAGHCRWPIAMLTHELKCHRLNSNVYMYVQIVKLSFSIHKLYLDNSNN